MAIRIAVAIAVIAVIGMAATEQAVAAAAASGSYLSVSFVAISDTSRDTTLASGSATPTTSLSASLMYAGGSGTSATMVFSLYSQPTGNVPPAFWVDTLVAVPIDAYGYVHVVLGTHKSLNLNAVSPWEVFYLEVAIAGETYLPRILVIPPGNYIELEVISGELPSIVHDPEVVDTPPLILSERPNTRTAIAVNPKSRIAQAIVFGGGGDRGGDIVQARLAYQLQVQQARIKALETENARLKRPPVKPKSK